MHIVDKAKKSPGLPPELKTDQTRVEGCLSNLWFVAENRDGRCYFRSDADSHIVKAIAVLLCDFYSGQPAREILAHNPEFLTQVGITQHLSPNRRNGLSRLWDKIRAFAESAA